MSGKKNTPANKAEKKPTPPATKPKTGRRESAAAGGGFKPSWNNLMLLALAGAGGHGCDLQRGHQTALEPTGTMTSTSMRIPWS
ncbi:MAG: hypothetical protein U0176_11215 [Bacteroidia bacterium]